MQAPLSLCCPLRLFLAAAASSHRPYAHACSPHAALALPNTNAETDADTDTGTYTVPTPTDRALILQTSTALRCSTDA